MPRHLEVWGAARYLTNGEKPSMGSPTLREKNPMNTPKYKAPLLAA